VRLLLDTSVLIDVLRGRKDRKELLATLVQSGHTLSTTALNVAEVCAGMRPQEESSTEALFEALECYEVTGNVGRMAGKLMNAWRQKGRTLELPDTMIAAICIERKCVLITDNRKDFPMQDVQLYPLREA
jgi:predicted nucleic acid-binding protein